MAVGQGAFTAALDVAALNAAEARLEVSAVEQCALQARTLREVLELHRVLSAAGAELATVAQTALLRQISENAATELLHQALLLQSLPGALEALDCGLLTVEQARVFTRKVTALDEAARLDVWRRLQARLLADLDAGAVLTPARLGALLDGWVITADPRDAVARRKDAEAAGNVDYRHRDDGLVDLFALGVPGPNAQAVLQRIRAAARPMNSLDDRPAGQRRVQALVDLILGRERLSFDDVDIDAGTDRPLADNAAVRHCGPSCGCRLGSPVPCGTHVSLLIPIGAALGTTAEPAILVGHGPIEPDLTAAVLSSAPRIRPVWVDGHGVPVATGDKVHVAPRDDPSALRALLLRLAQQQPPPERVPRHPDDHPPGPPPGATRHPDPPEPAPPAAGAPPRPSAPPLDTASRTASTGASSACHGGRLRPPVLANPHPTGTPGPYRLPARLRRLVQIRAPRCEWPGCGVRATACDIDHDRPWPYGPTCGCNCGPLCRRHHRLKQLLMNKARSTDSAVRWTDPTGRSWTSLSQHETPAEAVSALPDLTVDDEQHLSPDELDALTGEPDTDPSQDDLRAPDTDGDEPEHDRIARRFDDDRGWGPALDDPYRWAA